MLFKESTYEAPPSIAELEERGKQGNVVMLEGTKTGTAKIQVKLPYADYIKVECAEVQLSVVANLLILPADVHVMPYDVVEFKLYSVSVVLWILKCAMSFCSSYQINNGKMEEIKLPNTQYFLDVEDIYVASADPKTGKLNVCIINTMQAGNVFLHANVPEV